MQTTREMLLEFHTTFGAYVGTERSLNVGASIRALRHELVREEGIELATAFSLGDRVEMADALGDIIYVVEGAGVVFDTKIPKITPGYGENHPAGVHLGMILHYTRMLHDYLTIYEIDENREYLIDDVQHVLSAIKTHTYILANKWVIPLDEVIAVIHESNMSKVGEDGLAILREDGKIMKGPNYFTPTAKIQEILGADIIAGS